MIVYLDTSIPSFVLKTKIPDKKKATERLLKAIKTKRITAYISTVVIRELEKTTNQQKKKELMKVLNSFPYHLIELNEKIESLAQKYLASGIIPAKYQDDALHIAAAVVTSVPVIVSWNLRHMVNIFVKRKVNSINIAEGYPQVDLITPWEIIPPDEEG